MSASSHCTTCAVTLPIARFGSITDTRPVTEASRWSAIAGMLCQHTEREHKGGPLWSPVLYAKGSSRGNSGVVEVTAFVADVDDGHSPSEVLDRLHGLGLEFVVHSTHGSVPEKPKFRVAVPLSSPICRDEWAAAWARLDQLVTGGRSDPATKDPARAFYLPTCPPGARPFHHVGHGRALDVASLPAAAQLPQHVTAPAAPDFAYVSSLEALLQRVDGFAGDGPVLRRLLETTRGEPRSHATNLLLAWVLFKCGATTVQISRLVDWPEPNVASTLARFRRQGAYSYSIEKLAAEDPLLADAVDSLRSSNSGQPSNPWASREGWAEEPLLPILMRGVDGQEEPEEESGADEDGGPKPVEPGYVLYNRLIQADHFRPFRTLGADPRVAVPTEHGLEIMNPAAPEFVERVGYSLFSVKGRKVPTRSLKVAASTLTSRALSRSLPRARVLDLWLRIAPAGPYSARIDMVDEARRCIHVSPDGWKIEEVGHPIFDIRHHMLPLPMPTRANGPDGNWSRVERLWKYLTLPECTDGVRDQRLLVLADMVQTILAPDSPKLVKVLTADQGAGKSTMMARYQSVLDPSSVPHMKPPAAKDDDAAMNIAVNHANVNFDNVSTISAEFSDYICRISSGTGIVKRKLYSDSEETIATVWRSVLINGITATPRMADLLRRVLFLDPLRPRPHLSREELVRQWEVDHPEILGGLLDLAVLTARALRDVEIPVESSDMADYVRIGRALAVAIGKTPAHFQFAWDTNVDLQTTAAAQETKTAALFEFFSRFNPTTPPVTAQEIAAWMNANRRDSFPPNGASAQVIGNELARKTQTLGKMGVYIGRRTPHGGTTVYYRLDGPPDGEGGSENSENSSGGLSGPPGPPVHQHTLPSPEELQGSRDPPLVATENPGGPEKTGSTAGPPNGGPELSGPPRSTAGPPRGFSGRVGATGGPVDLFSSKSGTEEEKPTPAEEGLDGRARHEARKRSVAGSSGPHDGEWANAACVDCPSCRAPHDSPDACACASCSPWGHSNTAVGDRAHYCGPLEPPAPREAVR